MTLRILHVLDHSLPLHSGYVFRTIAILRVQRALGWNTFHLTTPRHRATAAPFESIDGWDFFRTTHEPGAMGDIPIAREIAEMASTARRLEHVVAQVRPDVLHAHSPVLNALPAI